ncbi:unnamed protein product (macronuclear) [Paramecium tetraurelia]|uniref:SANT domain-containing protein n=1 Tax=Paramecium tetraurelia TaxID=5888 RepID=A0BT84_PARTE|nr:uncharacterized protein GSPATT00031983001 [Paramecium tetraurelia]CAK61751.1 unnamed protein product [Paramecium tetraurelia]|eukprot:XP_001429149.1 hypothetical protein (macronuclear) [Paramecium tetraurelia strain d4-2]
MDSIQAYGKLQNWMAVVKRLVLVSTLIQQLICNATPLELKNSINQSSSKLNILLDKALICKQPLIYFNFQQLQMQFFIFHSYILIASFIIILVPDIQSFQRNKQINTKREVTQMHQLTKFYQSKTIFNSISTPTHIYIIYFFLLFLLSKFLPPNSITPLIFTKKLPQGGQYRFKGTQPLWVNALESLLSVVVQLYYKSDQELAEFMKEKVLIESKKELKQEKKPGRKKKILDNDSPNQEQTEQQQQQPSNTNVYSLLQQDVLDILISPLRSDFPFETWTTKEIAIFECGMCRYGKQYEFLSHLIKTKNAQDIIQFYYFWKFTSHYKLWKINKAYYHRSNLNNYV